MKRLGSVMDTLRVGNRPKTFLELVLLTDKAREGVRKELIGLLKRNMIERLEVVVVQGKRPMVFYNFIRNKKKG